MDSLRFPRPVTHSLGILVAMTCFLTLSADANSVQANYDSQDYKVFEYEKNLVIQCNISENSGAQFVLRWLKNDTVIQNKEDKYKIIDKENKLVIYRAVEDDVGNYTCQAVNAKTNTTENVMKAVIQVVGFPKISLPEDTPVVEGETLKLHCSVWGYPTPVVAWTINDKPVDTLNDSRITTSLKDDNDLHVRSAFLTITNVQMSDRNQYTCTATNLASGIKGSTGAHKTTFVRVKDKLAALWPFLGICAEVAILCTIILIYEKKRNKTELDESDTDQSPEQKNTPDHGKDVRQRK